MARVNTRNIEQSSMVCNSLEDLELAMKEIRDLDDGAEVKMFVRLEVPGLGVRKLFLLDDVPIQIEWEVETD